MRIPPRVCTMQLTHAPIVFDRAANGEHPCHTAINHMPPRRQRPPAARCENGTPFWTPCTATTERWRCAGSHCRAVTQRRVAVRLDTVTRRATQTEVTAQKARQGTEATQQIAVQKKEVRVIELPPVQIVGRRLSPDVQMAGNEGPSAVAAGATAATTKAAPEPAALAPLTAEVSASPHNAGQGFNASRVGLLPNAPQEQKPSVSSWAPTQR